MPDFSKATHRVCAACGSVNRVVPDKPFTSARCAKCQTPLASPHPIEIEQDKALILLDRDGGHFLIDVWAPWCGPCLQFAPHFAQTAARFYGQARFFKVNADDSPALSQRLGVRGIPALFLFKNGKQVSHRAGAVPVDALVNWIESDLHLKATA